MTLKVKLLPRTTIKGKVRGTGRDGIDGATGPVGPQGPQGIQGVQGPQGNPGTIANLDLFNVKDFGAIGDGSHDDTVNIQNTIYAAVAAHSSNIYMPSGTYKITDTIHLEPLGGGTAAFSLGLYGAPSCGNHEGFATLIKPTFNDRPVILVGPGQGNVLKDFCIRAPDPGDFPAGPTRDAHITRNLPANGMGIGYKGEGAASRSRTDNVLVENLYTAFHTGATGDGLNDSNTWIKCACFNCAVGFWIAQTQNFINSLYDCNPSATIGVLCGNGGGAHIHGGNYSVPGSQAASLPVSGISPLIPSSSPLGNTHSYTFTATVTPDNFFTGPQGVYNSFVFVTAHFGLVPCTLDSFTGGVATFHLLQEWYEHHFGTIHIDTDTDLSAEIQACTKVYCAEMVTTWSGANISVIGAHIENDNSPCTMILSHSTFGSNRPNSIKNVFWNTDPGYPNKAPGVLPTPSDADLARYYVAHSFPFIWAKSVDLYLSDSSFGITSEPVIIDGLITFKLERCTGASFNYRATGSNGSGVNDFASYPQEFDGLYFMSGGGAFRTSNVDPTRAPMKSPHYFFRPAPYTTPGITPDRLATLTGTLPLINDPGDKVKYPLLWGGQIYKITDFKYSAQPHRFCFSAHHYYSYGQDLTTTNIPGLSWSYKGQSYAVYVDAGTMDHMRCGLQLILNDGPGGVGGTDVLYFVTGIYPGLGYVTITQDPVFVGLTSGTKTSLHSGNLIKQEPFSFTYLA